MKIKPSYFDYSGEIYVCQTYVIDGKPAHLCIRRVKDYYELYARNYFPTIETVLIRGSLEEVVEKSNAIMRNHFGPYWEGDVVVPEDDL